MLTPEKYAETPVYDLLVAAGQGKIGPDLRWARSIVDRGEAALADLVRFGTEDRSEDAIVLDDYLVAMFRKLHSPAALPYFVEYLRNHPFEDLPEGFEEALYAIREHALEPLLKLYEELEEDESGEVAFLLASFRIPDDRVLRILLDRLEYDAVDGAVCLSLYGDPAAREPLQKMLEETDDDYVKLELRHALEDLDREREETDTEPFVFEEYFEEEEGPVFPALEDKDLLEFLECSDRAYRRAAAREFRNRDLNPELIARLLRQARADEDAGVRAACWEALASQSADNNEIFRAMLERLQDESAPMVERAGALMGLGQRANEQPIRQYAEQFYQNPETRAAALSAMWNSLDRSFAGYFPPHLEDPDLEIRKHAISGVGYLGIHEAAETLRRYFEDEDLRSNALFAYALSARSEISPSRVRSLFRRIEEFAHGLSEEEEELVQIALDERLMLHGYQPVFHAGEHRHSHEAAAGSSDSGDAVPARGKVGRNEPCPCGSGKKYKKCCGA